MEDRRTHPRVPAPLRATWHRGAVHSITRTANLSLGGCFLEACEREAPAGRLRLRLQLPRNELLWLSGEVAHVERDRGFGVRFVDLSDESTTALRRALAHLSGPSLV